VDWLIEQITSFFERDAIIHENHIYSYQDLYNGFKQWQKILIKDNVKAGEVVGFESDYSLAASSLFLALIANNNIVVPFSSILAKQQDDLIEIAQVKHLYRLIENGFEHFLLPHQINQELLLRLNKLNKPGLLLFTSGSTGVPKAVIHDFSKIIAKYREPRQALRTLTFLLLDHIGGINTLFHTISNGGTVIIAPSRKPEDVCWAIQEYQVELLPVSPTFLNLLLLSEQYLNYDFSSVKIISYGTEVMPTSLLQKLNQIFPQVEFRQTYGLSELGIMRTKSKASDSLWLKIGGKGYETKIVDGILYIKADSAMLGYLNAPCPFDEEGWFNTQDQVEVNGEYLRILGRKSDLINVGGQKVYPAEVEDIILQMPGVNDVTIKGETNSITGQIVSAKVNLLEPETTLAFKKRMREFCQDKLEAYKIPIKIEIITEELFNSRYKRIRE